MRTMFKFQRYTSSGKFYPEIDGLRFFAILPVFLAHSAAVFNANVFSLEGIYSSIIAWIFKGGHVGVQLFFVISGYILGLAFYKAAIRNEKVSVKYYYFRRLTRLEPPYVVVMTLFFLVSLALGRFEFFYGLKHYFASLFYVHNVVYGGGSIINTVAWSLEIELQFYVLAPLLFYVYRKGKLESVFILLVCIVFFCISTVFMAEQHRTLLSHGQFFVLGALMHVVGGSVRESIFNRGWYDAVLFGLLMMGVLSVDVSYYSVWGNLFKLFSMFLLFNYALCSRAVKRFLSLKVLYVTGGMCYSIYLIHYPLLSSLSKFWGGYASNASFWIFLPFAGVVVFFFSAGLYLLLEKPCMNPLWPNQIYQYCKNRWFN